MPATRPTDLQQWQFLMPRAGWVDVEIPLGGEEGGSVSYLHNFRVCRDGLETTVGWHPAMSEVVGSAADNPGSFLGVVSAQRTDGVLVHFFFFTRKIRMWVLQPNDTYSKYWVTPADWTGDVLQTVPDITFFQDKFYMAVPHATYGGVFYLDPYSTAPIWTRINGAPPAETIGTLGFRLVVGNTKNATGGAYYRIQWSGLNNPTSWDSLQTLDLPIHDEIIRFLPFGEHLLIVTKNRFFVLAYTGNALTPFGVQLATTLPSALKDKRQIASVALHDVNMIVYALDNGLYAFSGNESVLLSQNIDKTFKRTMSACYSMLVGYNPTDAEIFCVPFGTDFIDHVLVYQVLYRAWYRRDRPILPNGSHFSIINYSWDDKLAVPMFAGYDPSTYTLHVYKFRMPYDDAQTRGNQTFSGEFHIPVSEIGPPGAQKTTVSTLLWWTTQGDPNAIFGTWEVYLAVSHSLPQLTNPSKFSYTLVAALDVNGLAEEKGIYYTGRYIRGKIVATGLTTRVVFHGLFVFWH